MIDAKLLDAITRYRKRIHFLEETLDPLPARFILGSTAEQDLRKTLSRCRAEFEEVLGTEALWRKEGLFRGARFQASPKQYNFNSGSGTNLTTIWPVVLLVSDLLADGTFMVECEYPGLFVDDNQHQLLTVEALVEMLADGGLTKIEEP